MAASLMADAISFRGREDDLALAGLDDDGEAAEGAITVAFGPGHDADIVFSRTGAATEVVTAAGRVVATGSGATWRRAPWPVRDSIFDLTPPTDPRSVLLVGGDPEDVDVAAAEAARTGASPRHVDELTRGDLEAAACVIFARKAEQPFHPATFAAAAAGRLVLTGRTTRTFGLLDGIDCLASEDAGALGRWAGDAARYPDAFHEIRVWGRHAAERHRASLIYPRMLADLRMGL